MPGGGGGRLFSKQSPSCKESAIRLCCKVHLLEYILFLNKFYESFILPLNLDNDS